MGALYTHTNRGAIVLTPAIYNADHQNHIDNGDAAHLGGFSANVTQMQSVTDPGALGSESLAASIADEIGRIRFALARIVGGSKKWYEAPAVDLSSALAGYIYGLKLSNGTDATNDIDIAVGAAAADTGGIITLASGITKRLDAAWAVGTGNGGLDTGSVANGTYHMYLIERVDTAVVDAIFSLSVSGPALPANYTLSRRIGSIVRAGGTILGFKQFGDEFRLATSVQDVNVTSVSSGAVNRILLSIPAGLEVEANFLASASDSGGNTRNLFLSYPGESDAANGIILRSALGVVNFAPARIRTDTNRQVQTNLGGTGGAGAITLVTRGWIDNRGRLG